MDKAYEDKLDGIIEPEFFEREMGEWRDQEQQIRMAVQGLEDAKSTDRALDAERIFELANKALFTVRFARFDPKGQMLRTILSNCSVDAVSVTPTYRNPFDAIFKKPRRKNGRA